MAHKRQGRLYIIPFFMKKKMIGLDRKLFMRIDTIGSLDTQQSDKVVGGWVTNVSQTRIDPNPKPNCQSCLPPPQTANGCSPQPMTGGMVTCQGPNC